MRNRRLSMLAGAAGLAFALAACGELPHPFQPEAKDPADFDLMPVDKAGVNVRPPAGLPADASAAFTAALVDALHKEDVAAMADAGNAASLTLETAAVPETAGWQVTLTLADPRAQTLGGVTAHAAPKDAADPKSWASYAGSLARSVAALLPRDGTALAANQPRVAIDEITGMGDEDGKMLIRALSYSLKKAQVQLAPSPDQATHFVRASVTVAPPRRAAGQELRAVDVQWTVLRADRSEIGEVRQSNDVPAALLDKDWPDIAMAVAGGAVDGIARLVNQPATATR